MESVRARLGVEDEEEDARAVLGEELPVPSDPAVARILRNAHAVACPHPPAEIADMLHRGDAAGLHAALDAAQARALTGGGDPDDVRVYACGVCDLAPVVAQAYLPHDASHDAPDGSPVPVRSPHASLARALHAALFAGRVAAVLRFASRALDAYHHLTRGVVAAPPLLLRVDAQDDAVEVGRGWWDTVHRTRGDATRVSRTVVLSERHRAAYTCLLVHRDWRAEGDGTLLHRDGATRLRFAAHAFGGVVVVQVAADDDAWPAFLCECRTVPPALFGALVESSRATVALPAPKRRALDVDALHADRVVRAVAKRWHKSHLTPHAGAPVLGALRCAGAGAGAAPLRLHTATLDACRDDADAARCVFGERFGSEYASGALARLTRDAVPAVYAVRRGTDVVAAFGVLLFDAVECDGTAALACYVDSFAVATAAQGGGVGGAVFRDVLCALCAACAPRYWVFAQCVRTGDARLFWHDKLDESSAARSLTLQALLAHPERIAVQSEAQCTPRARQYEGVVR